MKFAYNAAGELIGHCSAKQVHIGGCDPANPSEEQAWRYGFDALGRQVTQTPPANTTATALAVREWSYQAGGRLGSVIDRTVAGGGTIHRHTDFGHDALGRVTAETAYLGSGTSNPELAWATTWNADGTRAGRSFDGSAASPAQGSDAWTFTYDPLGRPDQVKQGSTVVTDHAWNATGTLASRADFGIAGTTAFSYDWASRQIGVTAPTTFGSGSISLAYGLDGLLTGRTTPNGVTAALAYDGAKRPLQVDFGGDSLSRGYDRDGNVTAEGRSLSGVSGDAGTGTALFSYDGLGRVTAMDGLARDDAFSYDRNGNRLTKTEGATTTTYTYDRADQLTQQTIGATSTAFAYNAFGDMTSSADAFDQVTAHGYDAGGRLVSLTPPGASASTYGYDALGRVASRTTGADSLTYRYVGTGHVSYATDASSGADTFALIDATASRLALDTGGTTAWTLFDLHGNLAGAMAETSATVVSALRYDAYGQLLDDFSAGSGATETPWKFQGRLDVSPDADEALYDFGARMYRPSAGVFTQLDTYAGSAQNPLSMNRFLYAHANPLTLIDPDGHAVGPLIDGYAQYQKQKTSAPAKPPPPLLLEDSSTSINSPADGDSEVPDSSVVLTPDFGEVATPEQIAIMSIGELHAYALWRQEACGGMMAFDVTCSDHRLAVCALGNASGGANDCFSYANPTDWGAVDGPVGTFIIAPLIAAGLSAAAPIFAQHFSQKPELLTAGQRAAQNYIRGIQFQTDTLRALKLTEFTQNVGTALGTRVRPDALGRGILEVKYAYVTATSQIRGMAEVATRFGVPFDIVLGPNGSASRTVEQLVLRTGGSIWQFDPTSGFWQQLLGRGAP